jgi:sugar lactone lactonase YvrE
MTALELKRPLSSALIGIALILVLTTGASHMVGAEPGGQISARTVKAFPAKTFLESIVTTPQGSFLVSSYPDGKIYSVDPRGKTKVFAQIDGTIAGLAFQCPGGLLVNGWAGGKEPAVFHVSSDGKAELLLKLEGAMFPNGWSHLKGTRFLLADSFKGVIWEVDVAKRTARVWLRHELLARVDEKSDIPGVNGIKIYGRNLYASNGQRKVLLRIPIGADTTAGVPEVFVKDLYVDDFAFDTKGTLYGATHMNNTVVKVSPDGRVTTIGGLAEGLAGATAIAFGRGTSARESIFVTTNGGMSMPPPGGVQPGRVIRLDVGERASPLCF